MALSSLAPQPAAICIYINRITGSLWRQPGMAILALDLLKFGGASKGTEEQNLIEDQKQLLKKQEQEEHHQLATGGQAIERGTTLHSTFSS